jgi:membrane-associated HD superfamily phosphohydrolase
VAAAIVFLGVPFLMGGYFIQTQLRKMLIQARKNWSILLLYVLLSLLIPFINSEHSLHNWVIVVAPFAAFHACAYLYPKRMAVSTLLFFLTVGFILFQQYGTPLWKN